MLSKRLLLGLGVVLCLGVATFYIFVWPSNNNPGNEGGLRYFILRWFHPLAWIFLASACVIGLTNLAKRRQIASFVAFLALPTYAAFFIALLIN